MVRIIGTILLVGAVGFWWSSAHQAGSPSPLVEDSVEKTGTEYTIVLTENGFDPSAIEIKQGDTVVFTTKGKKPFWPASNLHPSHRDYPEFDPRKPIMSDDEWQFTFAKVGEWKFHDHLAPYYTGIIVVSK